MKRITFLCCCFSRFALGQQLDFKTTGVDVNDRGVEVHFNEQYRIEGKVRTYKVYGIDTVLTFKGKVRDNYLYGEAFWYDDTGKLAVNASFVLPEAGNEHTDTTFLLPLICLRGVLEGECLQWFADKNYPCKGDFYKHGKKNGTSTVYHPNGVFAQRVLYSDGKKNGRFESQDANGENYVTGAYVEDQKSGKWRSYYKEHRLKRVEWYGPSGKRDSAVTYATNGQMLYREHFLSNENVSEKYSYGETGKLLEYEHFSYGMQDSLEIWFHVNGKKESEVGFTRGLKQGKYRSWYENGAPDQEYTFVGGQREGLYISKYPNGKVKAKGTYHENQKTGKWYHYAPNGQLLKNMTAEMEMEEMDLEKIMVEPAVLMEPEIFEPVCVIQMPDPFPGYNHYVEKKGELDFLKKYKGIDLRVKIDQTGSAAYTILSAMKPKDKTRLMVYLQEHRNRWEACVLNGRPVISFLNVKLAYR